MSLERRIFLLALVGIVVVFFGVGSLLPDRWDVETQVTLPATPEKVVSLLSDFGAWQRWSTVNSTVRSDTQVSIEGEAGQPGHSLVWTTGQSSAQLRLTKVDDQGVHYDFLIRGGADQDEQLRGQGSIQVTGDGTGSVAVWHDGSEVSFIKRWFAWFGAQQEAARLFQESSFARLRQELEKS